MVDREKRGRYRVLLECDRDEPDLRAFARQGERLRGSDPGKNRRAFRAQGRGEREGIDRAERDF